MGVVELENEDVTDDTALKERKGDKETEGVKETEGGPSESDDEVVDGGSSSVSDSVVV